MIEENALNSSGGGNTKWVNIYAGAWHKGYLNIDTGEVEQNGQYPNAVYSDLIKVNAGMLYQAAYAGDGEAPAVRYRRYALDGEYDVGIGVEGRNLAWGTSGEWSKWVTPANNGTNQTIIAAYAYLPGNKSIGDEYTMALEIEFLNCGQGTKGTFGFNTQGAVDNTWEINNIWAAGYPVKRLTTPPQDGIYRYEAVSKIGASNVSATKFELGFRADYWDGNGKYRWRHIKVEKGNKATDWTPAPEDDIPSAEFSTSEDIYIRLLLVDGLTEEQQKNFKFMEERDMATVLTSSQQTFVDITDQRKLSAYLTSNLPKTQVEDPNVLPHTYAPSWAGTALKVTPVIFLDQTAVALGSAGLTVTWKRKDGTGSETALTSGESASGGVLTVNQNKLAASSTGMITYICYISYYDSETKNTVNITADMTYTLVKNAENARLAYVTADTYVFKYNTSSALVGATQATLNAQVQGVEILGWQYKKSDGTWADYPTTSDNSSITGAALVVKPAHEVFFNNVAQIKLLTDDDDVYDTITITKMYDGAKGSTGATGNGVKSTAVTYQAGTSGTTAPTGTWSTTIPTVAAGQYLWTRKVTTFTDNTTSTEYTVAKQGSTGATGKGVKSTAVTYQGSTSGTTVPTGEWGTSIPQVAAGSYLWTRTVITYTDNTTSTSYSVGKMGNTGATGSGGLSVILGNESQTVACTNGGLVSPAVDVTIPFTGYVGITQTACTVTVGTLPSGVTVKSNTGATASAAGSLVLAFAANANLGGASVMNGTIDLTFTISGKTVVKKFGWSKSVKGNTGAAGANAIVFSVYAPNGTVVQNQSGSLTLATAAYSGATAITSGATYQWAKYVNGTWTNISGATASTLAVSGADIVNIQSYRCTMTYGGKTYQDVITVEDKSDPYVSEMLSIGGFTVKNNLGGVVPYVIVRTNQKEVDALLGPISEAAPSSPASGAFWYKVDHTGKTVTLMKYNGSAWVAATEKQSLTYTWYKQDKDGNEETFNKTGKVIYLSAADIDSLATLQCDVSK